MNTLSLPTTARLLLASDMHLGSHDPDTADFFLKSLAQRLPGHTHLLLAGDLFEAWPGDDDTDVVAEKFIGYLGSLRDCTVFFMHGNRDFLLNHPLPDLSGVSSFSDRTGATHLDDPCILTLAGRQILLMHGDTLCTDDSDYLQWRQTCRDPGWQARFLAQSLAQRQQTANGMRQTSEQTKSDKSMQIMDVNQRTVDAAMTDANCDLLIHGHTHRPDRHRWQHDGRERQRLVLSDWLAATGRGDFLSVSASRLERLTP